MTRGCFGLDVHREFAQVAIWQDGLVRQAGQIAMTPEALKIFADSLQRVPAGIPGVGAGCVASSACSRQRPSRGNSGEGE